MIELQDDRLHISFPNVHPVARCSIGFQRTLRIPDDNREHYLPPGLGNFPLRHADDHAARLPAAWQKRGGVFLPMYQAEAMWIQFDSIYPFAIKVAAGKINAVTGNAWTNALTTSPQDYLILPDQPWLDGFSIGKGQIRQFVAMPLGQGYTTEEQLTGTAEHGGLQILAIPMRREVFELERLQQQRKARESHALSGLSCCESMGLAPGGLMRQEIYKDRYGIDAWDTSALLRCFVSIVNSTQYLAITGNPPPAASPTAKQYSDAGLPWFDYYAADLRALEGAEKLAGLDSVATKGIKNGKTPLAENEPVLLSNVKKLLPLPYEVREGLF